MRQRDTASADTSRGCTGTPHECFWAAEKILPFFSNSFQEASPPFPAFTPDSALSIHSPTASLQSSAAEVISGAAHSTPSSMMHGGIASEHFFRQTFAGVFSGPPHSSERTLVGQQAPSEFCPRTLLHVS